MAPMTVRQNEERSALVVEDEAIVRLELVGHLKRFGLNVKGAARGLQAVATAREQPIDLLLMDVRLAGEMTGIEAALEVRALHPACQIIYISAFGDDETILAAKASDPSAFLLKPFDRRTLILTIELALERDYVDRERRAREKTMTRHLALLDTSHDGIVSLDKRFNISLYNRGAERIFGWTAEEMLGQPLHRLLPDAVASTHDRLIEDFGSSGERSRALHERTRLHAKHRDGDELLVEISIAQSMIDKKRSFIAVIRDVTAQAQLEKQIRQGQRMDAIGRLATGVVHDLNNLLTMVTCSASLLRLDYGDSESIQQIFAACRGGAQLTHKLLRVAKPSTELSTSERERETHLGDVIGQLEPLLSRSLPQQVTSYFTIEQDLCVQGLSDSDIEQIVLNLFINARDAIDGVGQIDVRLHRTKTRADDKERQVGWISLEVQDTGSGMDRAARERAVDPFFSTKEGKGSGTGLTTVYNLTKNAGGQLEIESTPQTGTLVRVRFPVCANENCSANNRPTLPEDDDDATTVDANPQDPSGI